MTSPYRLAIVVPRYGASVNGGGEVTPTIMSPPFFCAKAGETASASAIALTLVKSLRRYSPMTWLLEVIGAFSFFSGPA